jgi:hypothetical protein
MRMCKFYTILVNFLHLQKNCTRFYKKFFTNKLAGVVYQDNNSNRFAAIPVLHFKNQYR